MDIGYFKKVTQNPNPMHMIASDIGNGGMGEDFIYCLENGTFYKYMDGYWREVFVEQISKRIEEVYPGIVKFSHATKEQVIKQLRVQVYRELSEFNREDLLNFEQGMFNARNGKLIEHKKEYNSTIRLKYPYKKGASCELWLSTLDGIFQGDKDKINILQEYLGYCLTKDVSREKALLLLGESRSGKSTILNVINYLIGEENTSSVALEFLSNPQYTAMLINKMVNIDWDVASGAEKFEANFKVITSGEPVGVNQKFIKAFTFRPYCKLIMAANRFPRITDHSSAFYKRLILLPCDRVFEPHEQDIKLKEKLKLELPGIFNWAVEGLHRLEERGGFEVSLKFMTDAIEELREESNPIDVFFKETIQVQISDSNKIDKSDLYKIYCDWCKENGNAPLSGIKFGQYVYQKYSRFTPKKAQDSITGRRIWRNLRLIKEDVSQEIDFKD